MIMNSKEAENNAVLNAAYAMCAAARTAPKACGIDHIETAVVSGEDIEKIADAMVEISEQFDNYVFLRDSKSVRKCGAIVLIGVREGVRGLGNFCRLCHYDDCAKMKEAGACCVYDSMDLGIALGSATALAADMRLDNRVMFTVGKAAVKLGLMGDIKLIMGIPLSALGKNIFFDRDIRPDK